MYKPGEKGAADAAKQKVQELRDSVISMWRQLARDPAFLKSCGYKTLEEAAVRQLNRLVSEEKKIWDQFLKQFPDD